MPDEQDLPTSLLDAADLLYGVGRDEFVDRRGELVKAVRAGGDGGGDKELATQIGALRKPSVAAWVANRLAREYPDEVGALEDLGASLREAQDRLEGDALRQLSRQRHELINALVERGRRIAREEDVRLGDPAVRELERTIGAALADPAAARALVGGQLAGALEPSSGLGDDSVAAALGGPASGTRPTRTARPARPARPDRRSSRPEAAEPSPEEADDVDDTAEQGRREERDRRAREERERAEREAQESRARADEARERAERAEETARAAQEQAEEADEAVDDLRTRLAAAEDARRGAWERADDAGRERDVARREANRTQHDADAADAALEELTTSR